MNVRENIEETSRLQKVGKWLKAQWQKTDLYTLINKYNEKMENAGQSTAIRFLNYIPLFFYNLLPEMNSFVNNTINNRMGFKFWLASAYSDFDLSRDERNKFIMAHVRNAHQPDAKYVFKFENLSILKIFNFTKPFYIGFEYLKAALGAGIDKLFGSTITHRSTGARVTKAIVQLLLTPIELPLLIATKVWDIPLRVISFVGKKIGSGIASLYNRATARPQQPSTATILDAIEMTQIPDRSYQNNNAANEQPKKTEQVANSKEIDISNNVPPIVTIPPIETTPEQSVTSPTEVPLPNGNQVTSTVEKDEDATSTLEEDKNNQDEDDLSEDNFSEDELADKQETITAAHEAHTEISTTPAVTQSPVVNTAQITTALEESNNNQAQSVTRLDSPPITHATSNTNVELNGEVEDKKARILRSPSITRYSVLSRSANADFVLGVLGSHVDYEEKKQTGATEVRQNTNRQKKQ